MLLCVDAHSPNRCVFRASECHRSWCACDGAGPTATTREWPDHWPDNDPKCWASRRSSQSMWCPSAVDGVDGGGVAVGRGDDGGSRLGLEWL